MTEKLGRFGHHPDPAIDFCCEVDALVALQWEVANRIQPEFKLSDRVAKALEFRVGGDERSVKAKAILREMNCY